MARLNVYVPDELAERAKAADLNISALAQAAIADELQRQATTSWLETLPAPRATVSHHAALEALDGARSELADTDD
ncbi:type II toxin-antitoxin system CcdA family antitoxin [Amycolatopsis suaedae]|uniref:Antitoxin n=1 Tax=Amycolatopsis suaedae TaxID=2510978 RepID=A0A4Q7IZV7_9PSEU|nr:type II toxin-antitoxin system CcdA family antitoxin [Amycolatopsis suaedae]RZQ60059.1 antitoxin [Amycolatopsis suaedae]